MAIDLEELGFTEGDLIEKIADRVFERVWNTKGYDYDHDEEVANTSAFGREIEKRVQAHIDERIDAIAAEHVLPDVTTYIENLCLQETNKWGETKGESYTFVEYLVKRAEHYMHEEVDFQGKVKGRDSYSWKKEGTRLVHLLNSHLHYNINRAMEEAFKDANGEIVKAIQDTVKIKLADIAKKFKVTTKI